MEEKLKQLEKELKDTLKEYNFDEKKAAKLVAEIREVKKLSQTYHMKITKQPYNGEDPAKLSNNAGSVT